MVNSQQHDNGQPVQQGQHAQGRFNGLTAAQQQQLHTILGSGFYSAFEYAAIGMALVDLEGHCLAANRGLCEMLGCDEPELLGTTFQTFTHPEDLLDNLHYGRQLISGEIPSFQLEKRYIDKAGRTLWVLLSASLVRDGAGNPLCVISQIQDISARKRMETALRESEARYRSLIDASPDAVCLIDLTAKIIFANPQLAHLLGYDRTVDLIGIDAISHVADEYRSAAVENIQEALQTGVLRNIVYHFIRKDGAHLPVEVSASVVRDTNGKPEALLGVIRDITERKRVEDALRESEERYRSLVQTSPDAITLTDLEGRILFGNAQMARQSGYSSVDEIMGHRPLDMIAPEDRPRALENLQAILLTGKIDAIEYTLLKKDGTRFPGEISASLITDANGKPAALIGVTRDITARRQAEQALRESEERYRQLVEFSPNLIGVSMAGRIAFLNPAGLRLLGADHLAQVAGLPVLQFVHPAYRPELAEQIGAFERGGGANLPREEHWLRMDGTAIDVESAAVPITYEGQPGIQVVAHDITARKQAEAAAREQRALAEALRDSAAALNSTLHFDQVLDRLLANAGRVVPHDATNIMLIDRKRDEACVVRAHGYAERGLGEWVCQQRFALSAMPDFRQMVQTGQPLIVPDTRKDPHWIWSPETEWLLSYAAAPIRVKGETVGFLNFDSETPEFFTSAHVERLQAFADQAAVAIENARLFESTRRSVERLTMLYQASMALARAESLDTLYQAILHWARQLAETSVASLTLFDGDNHLVTVAAAGMPEQVIGSRIQLGEGLNGSVAQARAPIQMPQYGDWDGRLLIYTSLGVKSVAGFPLIWQDRLVGTLAVADQQRREFDDDDMHMLTLFASLAAAALEQRRAVAEAQAREAEANALSTRLTHAQEEERARIAEQLHDSIGYRLVALQKNTEMAQAILGPDHALAESLAANLKLLQETHQQARTLATDLNSKVLADLGLAPAARQFIERMAVSTGNNVRMHITGRIRRLPGDVERVAFRGAQEAVINALRHAHATEIAAQLHFGARTLRLTVEDNGRGFDTSDYDISGNGKSTLLGLPELRRQVDAVRGEFTLESTPRRGTMVVLALPIQASILPDKARTRVLLVDDHETTRQGLRMLLAQSDEFACAGEAGDGLSALRQVELSHPDLVILDLQLPGINGIETARQISKRFPQTGIVILSFFEDESYLQQAFQSGARGYLIKSDDNRQIIAALKAVRGGEHYVSPSLADAWSRLQARPPSDDPLSALTSREREVFQMIVGGNINRTVGEQLGISVRTVEVHRKNIMSKLRVRNLTQLIKFADHAGILGPRA